jgi:hypothetical protein
VRLNAKSSAETERQASSTIRSMWPPICDRRQWQRNPDIAQRERRYRAEWIESPVPDLHMNNHQRIAVL